MNIYRISLVNGRFDHAASKSGAVKRALEMLNHTLEDGPGDAKTLMRNWGVTFTKLSRSDARAVGFDV